MKQVTRNGVTFSVVDDTADCTFWDISGWESANYNILQEMSKVHSTYVHAGAWIGPFTLFCANLYDKVYGLEPDVVAYEELKRNIALNNYNNITIENKAFLDKPGSITIGSDYSELGRSGTSMFQNNHAITVEAVTLAQYFKQHNLPKNCMLQLDVEGAEYCLLSDTDFFKEYTPTVLLSLHLMFLTDEHYNILYSGLEKLAEFYDVDLNLVASERAITPYKGEWRFIDILLKPKQ